VRNPSVAAKVMNKIFQITTPIISKLNDNKAPIKVKGRLYL